jgi:hypothetical protein
MVLIVNAVLIPIVAVMIYAAYSKKTTQTTS